MSNSSFLTTGSSPSPVSPTADLVGYLVVDTETNDLPDYKRPADDPDQPRLASIAMIPVNLDLEVTGEPYVRYVLPDGWAMKPGATAVNGLTTEFLLSVGIPISDVLAEYATAIKSGRGVIAFNSRHDCKVLRGELRRAGMDDLFEQTPNICTMRASGAVLKLKNRRGGHKWPSLTEACAAANVERGLMHTALGDAMAALFVARWLKEQGQLPAARVFYAKETLEQSR